MPALIIGQRFLLRLWGKGIFLGFCANVIVKDVGDIAWRLELGSAFIPAFILAIGIWFCPESPRWLMKHGRHAEGFQSMCKLRAHPIIGARDFYYSWVIYEEELKEARGAGYFARLWDCFAVPRIRRANYGASTIMLAQQLCGINSKSVWLTLQWMEKCSQLGSYIILQFKHFPERWLFSRRGIIRISGLRCYSGYFHNTYAFLD